MLTRDHVIWAYRLLLNREPESEEMIQHHLKNVDTTAELRKHFMATPEYRAQDPFGQALIFKRTIVMTELEGGLRLFVDLADQAIGRNIVRGLFEQAEYNFARSSLKIGQTALDIGANVGLYSIGMADALGPSGRVYSFEPMPGNAELLERSIAENGFQNRITLERAAVGEVSGTAHMLTHDQTTNSGAAYLVDADVEKPANHTISTVPLLRMDDYPLRRPVSFIKIDVEGAEPLVFRGAERILREDRPLILSELHPSQLRKVAKCEQAELLAEMAERGYECRAFENGGPGQLIEQPLEDGVWSVVFVPKPA